jgi:hypothetical protein
MVNPGLEVWSCRYANEKPDSTNRTIFFLLCGDAGMKAQFWDLSQAVNVPTYLAWHIRTKKRCVYKVHNAYSSFEPKH